MSASADGMSTLLDRFSIVLPAGSAAKVTQLLFADVNIPSLDVSLRRQVLQLLRIIVRSERWLLDAGSDSRAFCTGIALAVEGEKDPRCLLVTLEIVQRTLCHFAASLQSIDGGTVVLEELFDVTACYFPIAFTPPPKDPHGITRAMLASALTGVFASTYRIAHLVMPLLFEKLSSSIMASKLDAIEALRVCMESYGQTAILPFVREASDSLRNEAVHGSDADVAQAALACVRTMVTTLTGFTDSRCASER